MMKSIMNRTQLRVRCKKGFVLVATLWSLALFGTVIVISSWGAQGTINEVTGLSSRAQAQALADGAFYLSVYHLLRSRSFSRGELRGAEQITALDGRMVTISVQDESGKLNLMRAETGLAKLVLDGALACSDHKDEVVAAVMTWRAGKASPGRGGAAGRAGSPEFLDFDELREIRHMTPRLLERVEDVFTLHSRLRIDNRMVPEPLRLILDEYAIGTQTDAGRVLRELPAGWQDPEPISGSGLYSITVSTKSENGVAFTRYATVQIDLREGGRYRLLRWNERSERSPDEFDQCEISG